MRKVIIKTGSRLHAGFYYAGGEWNVKWGSAGFYIEKPSFVAEFSIGKGIVEAPEYIKNYMMAISKIVGIEGIRISVRSYIPHNVGFGSSTQSIMAIVTAIKELFKVKLNESEIFRSLGIGKYSGVGFLLFNKGGFVADAGIGGGHTIKGLISLKIPEDWRFIYIKPYLPRGFNEAEEKIMENLWNSSEGVKKLMSYGLLRLASGIARHDLEDTLEGLRSIQEGTGLYFSKIQGGVYRKDVLRIANEAWKSRIILAQSSWGPLLYTISTQGEAEGDAELLRSILKEVKVKGEVGISSPRNKGYEIQKE
ncbi:MAG: hypothetical protein F7B11_05245 [Caldisphaeraceae archaeon]|nr:hypothetical protein [Caldisphaeraceae archaeon]